MSSILILDLETQNHEYYGTKASPYCPDNYVVESGWRIDRANSDGSTSVGAVQHRRFSGRSDFLSAPSSEWVPIPDDCWLIVAHNAAYEVSWFLQFARPEFEAFLKRGGRVYCTMHGEYLATDQTSLYPSLDETAPKYGGTHKVDGIKILWEQGVLTSEIDPMLLHEYLCGLGGDIENTAKVFYGQYQLLSEQGKFPLVWERMDALLSFAYCEWFGLWVDMPTAQRNQAEQEQRISELKQELNKYLPELPETLDFNFGSDFHMSALVYGGAVKYRKRVPYNPPQYVKEDVYKFGDDSAPVDAVEEKGIGWYEGYCNAPVERYKAGKNKGLPKVFRVDTLEEKLKWADDLFTFPGLVQIHKLPQHLQEKYGDRGEFRQARLLPDGTPVFSTGTDAMKGLAAQGFEFAKLVNELAALEKDVGSFYLRVEYNEDGSIKKQSGMLQYVIPQEEDGSGIIHHNLNTCATATGRLSSSKPNLQQLPRDGTSKVKQMFTSRYGADGRIVEVDYSALEVVMGCVLSGDTKLLQLLQDGIDMHVYRLSFQEGMPYDEVYERCHNQDHPEHKLWKQKRTNIKAPSFAAQYGASAKGIAFATGIPLEDCQRFLDNEEKLFPVTSNFKNIVRAEVERTGNLPGNLHREQMDDGSFGVYRRGYWTAASGMRYSFRQKQQWRDGRQVMDYKTTEMANYQVQGSAFEMMAVAAGMVIRHLVSTNFYDGKVSLLTNTHDALYIDTADEETAVVAGNAVKHCMETARERMLTMWPNYGILNQVPFPAAGEYGPSMYEKKHLPTVEDYYA